MCRGRFAGVLRVFQNAFCCYKFSLKIEKMLPSQVTARELMTFFFGNQHDMRLLSEVAAQESGDLQKNYKKIYTRGGQTF